MVCLLGLEVLGCIDSGGVAYTIYCQRIGKLASAAISNQVLSSWANNNNIGRFVAVNHKKKWAVVGLFVESSTSGRGCGFGRTTLKEYPDMPVNSEFPEVV
jgi:hypothetical protein